MTDRKLLAVFLCTGLGDAIASRASKVLFTLSFNGEDYRKRFVLPSNPQELF